MLIQIPRLVALAAFAALACALPVAAHHPGDDPTMAVASVGGAEATLSGTIEELVVVDQVNAATQRYPILRQGDGSRVPLRGEAIQTLTTGSQVSVLGNRTGTSFTVDHVVSAAPATKSAQVARVSTTQVEGRFMVAHHDNFETGSSQFLYHVFDTQGGVTELAMPFLPGSLATGMEVNVEGTVAEDGASVVPNQIVIQAIPPVLEATVTTNYLVTSHQVSDQRCRTLGIQCRSVHARSAQHRGVRQPADQERQGVLQGGFLRTATVVRRGCRQRLRRISAGHGREARHL